MSTSLSFKISLKSCVTISSTGVPGKSRKSKTYFTWTEVPTFFSMDAALVINTLTTPAPTVPYPNTATSTIVILLFFNLN